MIETKKSKSSLLPEHDLRVKRFVEAAEITPPSIQIGPLVEKVKKVAPAKTKQMQLQPLGDDFAVKDDKSPAEAKKTAPKPAKAAPWAFADDRIVTGYNFRMNQTLHMKMLWITENVPRQRSLQKLIGSAVEEVVERLLKEHYKPE